MVDDETKQILIEEISKFGNVYLSCLKVGVNKATYYRWKQQDEKFREESDEAERLGRGNISDVAEHALLQNVKKGNQKAIEYVLSHNSAIYRNPLLPLLRMFEDVYPGEGLIRYRRAMILKRKFEETGGIPLKPSGDEIKDTELEWYEKFIKGWYKEALEKPLTNSTDTVDSKSEKDKLPAVPQENQKPLDKSDSSPSTPSKQPGNNT